MKKRLISTILAALMVLSAIVILPVSAYTHEPVTIEAPTVYANGSEVDVTIAVKNPNSGGLDSYFVEITIPGCTITALKTLYGRNCVFNELGHDSVRLLWVDNETLIYGTKDVITLTVKLPNNTVAGSEYAIILEESDDVENYVIIDYSGDYGTGVGANVANGKIIASSPSAHAYASSGDVNKDGKINAKDVSTLMKYIVGKSITGFDRFAADVNADEKINAKDVTKLMKYLVGDQTARLGHDDVLKTVTPSTCVKHGNGTLTCSICGDKKYVTLPLKRHTKGEGKVTKPATCGAQGERTYYCTVCGTMIERETIPATGKHSWDAGKVTTQPTSTKDGVRTYTCTVCGKKTTEKIPKLVPAWKEAYKNIASGKASSCEGFALIDLNSDGIPELIVYERYGCISIYTYSQSTGKTDELSSSDVHTYLYYTPGGNQFLIENYGMGVQMDAVYSISGGRFVVQAQGGVWKWQICSWGGSTVSDSVFSQILNGYKNKMVEFNFSNTISYSKLLDALN